MRQVVLDTETTGFDFKIGNRMIEIGCVELVNRRFTGRTYHQYINPEYEVEEGAFKVHGLSNEFLSDKPVFTQVAEEFMQFIDGAELVIHNAPFDVGFINHEFKLAGLSYYPVENHCQVLDTLTMAREKHPGQRNTLDALCKRYGIDNSHRQLHGALLDAEILADVYLLMSGGQKGLQLDSDESSADKNGALLQKMDLSQFDLPVIKANDNELAEHEHYLDGLGEACLWRNKH